MGLMLTFMFVVNMVAAMIFLPALCRWLLRPREKDTLGATAAGQRPPKSDRSGPFSRCAREGWDGAASPRRYRRAPACFLPAQHTAASTPHCACCRKKRSISALPYAPGAV